MATRDNVPYKVLYAALCFIKDSFRTLKTNIYCFAAQPKVQSLIWIINRML